MYEINPKAVYNHFGTYLFLRKQVKPATVIFCIILFHARLFVPSHAD